MEGAKLACLQRYPAGDSVYAFHKRLPYSWLLKVRPRDLPGFVRQISLVLGGPGPYVSPHINNGRPNLTILPKARMLRSIWCIAKALEMNPGIRGLCCVSWLFSAETGKTFPHLAWLRDIYADAGAYVVELWAASLDSGFSDGSPLRQKLYAEGKFNPRLTLVVWPRKEMLAWASQHPELANADDELITEVTPGYFRSSRSPRPVIRGRYNSNIHLLDGLDIMHKNSKLYVALFLLSPALILATVACTAGWWIGISAFLVVFAAAWIFQYYCLQ
jgi:hypothetical protein